MVRMTDLGSVRNTDILIVGGGGAAAIAALEINRLGIKPLLVCKDTFLGGATVQASGGTSIPFLPDDTPSLFMKDTLKSGCFLNNHRLVQVLAEEAKEVFYDLERDGCILDRSFPDQIRVTKRSEGHSIIRSYADRRQIHGIVNVLKRRIFQEKIPLLEERILIHLFVEDRQVQGGLFFSLEEGKFELISAKVVILATGGCGQLYSVTTNANCLTGDGYALAFQAGADLIDMEMVQFLPLAFPRPATMRGSIIGMCSLFGPKVKLYNGLHERYMERYAPKEMEYATRDVVARANYLEIQEGRGTSGRAIVVDATENERSLLKGYRDSYSVIYAMISDSFGRKAANWQAPFEAIPSQHFMMGGVRIDENCRSSISNLLCCGEVAGGLHGANRLGGNALTEIYVFGRRAGRQAVDKVSATLLKPPHAEVVRVEIEKRVIPLSNSEGIVPHRIRQKLQNLMWDHAGIVRDGEGLRLAIEKLRGMRTQLPRVFTKYKEPRWNREFLEALELLPMIRTAELIAASALLREESRGSHYRRDFPETDAEWLQNVVLRKDIHGEIAATIDPIKG